MKKRMNIIFFGLCFLAALIAEAYCFQVLNGEWISTAGISIVVIITGYLFMDAVRSIIKTNIESLKFYTDRNLREETERWSERYTEMANLMKATYTATKKNTATISEQINKVLFLLQERENNSINERQMLIDLQKKSMEGQKNALNMEIHYNKENTKQLIEAIKAEGNQTEVLAHLTKILQLFDVNNDLLKNYIDKLSSQLENSHLSYNDYAVHTEDSDTKEHGYRNEDYDIEDYDIDNYEDQKMGFKEDITENDMEEEYYPNENIQKETLEDSGSDKDIVSDIKSEEDSFPTDLINNDPELQENKEEPGFNAFYSEEAENKNVKPLYGDPNKALTADEIAALFASAGL